MWGTQSTQALVADKEKQILPLHSVQGQDDIVKGRSWQSVLNPAKNSGEVLLCHVLQDRWRG
jgi:hypothetical protein